MPPPIEQALIALAKMIDEFGSKYPDLEEKLIREFSAAYTPEEIDRALQSVAVLKDLLEKHVKESS